MSTPGDGGEVVPIPMIGRVSGRKPGGRRVHDAKLAQVARAQQELDAAHRVIWLLAQRAGGEVEFSHAELAAAPQQPWITHAESPDGLKVRAR